MNEIPKNFKLVYNAKEIDNRVGQIADNISNDYRNSTPVLIGVLKGSFIFLADLVRKIKVKTEIEFVRLKSYEGLESSNDVKLIYDLKKDLKNRDVLIIEDIIDTGNTLKFLYNKIQKMNPKSISVVSFLLKKNNNKFNKEIKYVGFEIPSDFVVGYGMDFDEEFRNLDSLYKFSER
jgi:hypoxanthine phosphoribosyltransferase